MTYFYCPLSSCETFIHATTIIIRKNIKGPHILLSLPSRSTLAPQGSIAIAGRKLIRAMAHNVIFLFIFLGIALILFDTRLLKKVNDILSELFQYADYGADIAFFFGITDFLKP